MNTTRIPHLDETDLVELRAILQALEGAVWDATSRRMLARGLQLLTPGGVNPRPDVEGVGPTALTCSRTAGRPTP